MSADRSRDAPAAPALYELVRGSTPLLIDVPHAGTLIPPELAKGMTPAALAVPDTDWHVPLLYRFAVARGASLMVATHSRYVIDLNRDPHNRALYAGADNTELCPLRSFDREPLYRPDCTPDSDEVQLRREAYWAPYHAALKAQLDCLRSQHGHVVLLDAHSIRSQVPRFFSGKLPDLNLGTADGAACVPQLQARALRALEQTRDFSLVLNGRFKGGYITRRYGLPAQHTHALQLELAQCSYLDEARAEQWDAPRAARLIGVLQRFVDALLKWKPA
jgi:N-formylglutamate amidohydrolase